MIRVEIYTGPQQHLVRLRVEERTPRAGRTQRLVIGGKVKVINLSNIIGRRGIDPRRFISVKVINVRKFTFTGEEPLGAHVCSIYVL
jgi:hypothetical protein